MRKLRHSRVSHLGSSWTSVLLRACLSRWGAGWAWKEPQENRKRNTCPQAESPVIMNEIEPEHGCVWISYALTKKSFISPLLGLRLEMFTMVSHSVKKSSQSTNRSCRNLMNFTILKGKGKKYFSVNSLQLEGTSKQNSIQEFVDDLRLLSQSRSFGKRVSLLIRNQICLGKKA